MICTVDCSHLTDLIIIGKLSSFVSTRSHMPFGLSMFESDELLFIMELAFSYLERKLGKMKQNFEPSRVVISLRSGWNL